MAIKSAHAEGLSANESEVVPIHKRIRAEIESAFRENRAFPFALSASITGSIRGNEGGSIPSGMLQAIQDEVYHSIAEGDATVEQRLQDDVRQKTKLLYHHEDYPREYRLDSTVAEGFDSLGKLSADNVFEGLPLASTKRSLQNFALIAGILCILAGILLRRL